MDLGYTYSRRAWRSVDVFEVNPPWIDALLAVLSQHAGDCYGPIVRRPAVFERESDLKSTTNWQRRRREDRRRKLIFATTYYAAFTLSAALALTITIATVLRRDTARCGLMNLLVAYVRSRLSCHATLVLLPETIQPFYLIHWPFHEMQKNTMKTTNDF